MKKQRKALSALLAGMLITVPNIHTLAATSYDASEYLPGQILFPGDSLINIGTYTIGSEPEEYMEAEDENGDVQPAEEFYQENPVAVIYEGEMVNADHPDY